MDWVSGVTLLSGPLRPPFVILGNLLPLSPGGVIFE